MPSKTPGQIAVELGPEFDRLIEADLDDPAQRNELIQFLWDNKMGLLRMTQGYAALTFDLNAEVTLRGE
jgi:hypothetical protein